MGKKYEFSNKDLKKMITMYRDDFEPAYKIGLEFKVDPSVIILRLKKMGVNVVNGSPYNKQYWQKRGLSEDKIEEHIKTLRPVNKEFWIKMGYTKDEAILQIEGQKMTSLRGCIARYGEEEGNIIWKEREGKRIYSGKRSNTNIQYWIDKGCTIKEAEIKLSERQSTFSKEKCIERYGEEAGLKWFTKRQIKWSKSLSSNGNLKIGYSKISQELFYKLLETYTIKDREDIYFATHNKEFKIERDGGGIWLYDFTDIKNKKIIEYNGDDYHGNPKKYIAEDRPHPFRKNITAQEIWDKDGKKLEAANESGFDVLVVWDSEYRWKNKEEIIDNCIKFLKG